MLKWNVKREIVVSFLQAIIILEIFFRLQLQKKVLLYERY